MEPAKVKSKVKEKKNKRQPKKVKIEDRVEKEPEILEIRTSNEGAKELWCKLCNTYID